MKKLIFILGAVLISSFVRAQDSQPSPSSDVKSTGFYIGARYLPTFSSFELKQVNGNAFATSFVLGYGWEGLIGVNLSPHVGLQGELLYSSLAQKYVDQNNHSNQITLDYLSVPLLLVLNTNTGSRVNLNVVVGPQWGLKTGSSFQSNGTSTSDTVTAVLGVKPMDFGIAYGGGLDFALSEYLTLDIGYRGVVGLIDISDHSQNITTNQYYILDRSHTSTYAGYLGLKIKF